MGDAEISTSQWRLVEVGRVVVFKDGEYSGRLAAIVEIIDHKRVWESRSIGCWTWLTMC
jgi:large subunit ribosomal protein L14e